jgi:deoxyribonuclease V
MMFLSHLKWPDTVNEANKMQEVHKSSVKITTLSVHPTYVAGVDAAFCENRVFAAACLYRMPEFAVIDKSSAFLNTSFPYVPGYLFFREGPAIIAALKKLMIEPDVILVDGQGIAHPRGIGSASHLGLLLDTPTIGCAKTRLVGEFEEPASTKGSRSPLIYHDRVVGSVLRTRNDVNPLFISPGHRIDIEGAVHVTIACLGKYRIPEPLRCAHILSKKFSFQGP